MKAARLAFLLAFLLVATHCSESISTETEDPTEENPDDQNPGDDNPPNSDEEDLSPAVNLGALSDATFMEPWAINERGEIVGWAWVQNGSVRVQRVFHYSSGIFTNLGEGVANDISETGRIVGASGEPATLWEKSGDTWKKIALPGDAGQNLRRGGSAIAINGEGNRIVGWEGLVDQTMAVSKATLWVEESGQWTVTALPSNTRYAQAWAFNEQFIVGKTSDDFSDMPVVWSMENGEWTVHALPVPAGTQAGIGRDINAGSEIAGSILDASSRSRAVIWTPTAEGWNMAQVIGDLGGGSSGGASINDLSEIVGSSTTANGHRRGYIWTANGGIKDLGAAGGNTSTAVAINRLGEIVGSGRNDTRLVMWPVSSRPS